MINVVTKFLHNDIADLSVFDAELEHHEFDDVTVIKCNHRTTVSTYINAVSSSASTTVVLNFNDHFWYGDLAKTSTDYEFNRISISLDDIIDHSYDYEPNPFYRMKMAIDANIEIISDRDLAISLHEENKERFENNIQNYIAQYDIILGNTLGELDAFI